MDAAGLLRVMERSWNQVFRSSLGRTERSLVNELRDVRNRWAHQETFSTDDAYRALDSTQRLLAAVGSPQAIEVERMKKKLWSLPDEEAADGPASPVGLHVPPSKSFWAYTDRPTKKSRIHKATCRYCNHGRGVSGARRSDNWWHGPYASRAEAKSSLNAIGEIHECKICRP